MAGFVKLDAGILESTLWGKKDSRDLFITALLMAMPYEVRDPMEAMCITSMEPLGFTVPVGWYGFIAAAGVGIIRRSGLEHERGMRALEDLAAPEPDSRSPDHDGRRMVRVDGGFIVLNFIKYRDKDHTSALRSKRWRQRQKDLVTRDERDDTRDDTQAEDRSQKTEADSEVQKQKKPQTPRADALGSYEEGFERFWQAYGHKTGKLAAQKAWAKIKPTGDTLEAIVARARLTSDANPSREFYQHAATWLNGRRWEDEVIPTRGGAPKRRVADGGDWTGNSEPIQEI